MSLHAILVHGLGRTPISMHKLAKALQNADIQTHSFYHCAAFEGFDRCQKRLLHYIETHGTENFVVIGHSLGTVLLRAVVPVLKHKPQTCFFLAPPIAACRAAKFFGAN